MVIFYDGEYSGLNTSCGHGILSIAAIDGNNSEDRFHKECKLKKYQTYDKVSLKIVGVDEFEIYNGEDRESLEDIMGDFNEWILKVNNGKKSCLVSQNNPKDLEQLWNGFQIVGIEDPLHYRNLDLHSVAIAYHLLNNIEIPSSDKLESNLSSTYLSEFVGIPDEPKPHSTALAGVLQTAEIYNRLMFGKKLLEEFRQFEVPIYLLK